MAYIRCSRPYTPFFGDDQLGEDGTIGNGRVQPVDTALGYGVVGFALEIHICLSQGLRSGMGSEGFEPPIG